MENDFEVNETDLDGEWLRQAVLYNKWAGLSAKAIKNQAVLHLQRKILKASLYKSAKEAFEKVGKKPTGADLESEVRTNKEYEELSLKLIDAEEQTNLMDGAKWSMVEKGKALERLCGDRDKGFFMPTGSTRDQERPRLEQSRELDKELRQQRAKISR